MITVANRIYVDQKYADAFEQRFRERAGLVDQMPGFISNQVLRPVNEGDPYRVFTIWNTRWARAKEHAERAVRDVAERSLLPGKRIRDA